MCGQHRVQICVLLVISRTVKTYLYGLDYQQSRSIFTVCMCVRVDAISIATKLKLKTGAAFLFYPSDKEMAIFSFSLASGNV